MKLLQKRLSLLIAFTLFANALLPILSAHATEGNNPSVLSEQSNSNNDQMMLTGIYRSILEINEEDMIKIKRYLENQGILRDSNGGEIRKRNLYTPSAAAVAAPVVAVYFIPGIGEVALLATGAIVVGGLVYYAGSWLYDQIMPYIIALEIPKRLLKNGNTVDLSKFNQKIRGKVAYKEDGGWYIEKDETKHRGSKWKLKNPNKRGDERVASLDENGRIVGP